MYARDEALRLGLKGWVRNRSDGSVEALAEGEAEDVAAFVRWCRGGPPMARVADVQVDYAPAREDIETFAVTY
jgi:acylphosphatase